MTPDDISRQAERIRQHRSRKRKPFSWNRMFSSRKDRQRSPYSYWVYSRIYPHGFNVFIWVFLVLTAGFVSFAVWYLERTADWVFYMGMGFVGLFALRWLVYFLGKVFTYSRYRNFFRQAPFAISGWDRLGSRNFPQYDHWILKSAVEVRCKPGVSAEEQKRVNDALLLFNQRANKCFYAANQVQAGFAGDPRDKWRFETPLRVIGSANSGVMGEAYILMHRHLAVIQQHYACIEAVVFDCHGEARKVDTVDVSID